MFSRRRREAVLNILKVVINEATEDEHLQEQLVIQRCINNNISSLAVAAKLFIPCSNSNFKIVGIDDYVEKVVPNFSDNQFKEHFRISRSSFEILLRILKENITKKCPYRIPEGNKVLMSLWYLANGELPVDW